MIGAVHPGGACYRAGVPPGVLVTVGGQQVHSVADLSRIVGEIRATGQVEAEFVVRALEDEEIGYEPEQMRRPSNSALGPAVRSPPDQPRRSPLQNPMLDSL